MYRVMIDDFWRVETLSGHGGELRAWHIACVEARSAIMEEERGGVEVVAMGPDDLWDKAWDEEVDS